MINSRISAVWLTTKPIEPFSCTPRVQEAVVWQLGVCVCDRYRSTQQRLSELRSVSQSQQCMACCRTSTTGHGGAGSNSSGYIGSAGGDSSSAVSCTININSAHTHTPQGLDLLIPKPSVNVHRRILERNFSLKYRNLSNPQTKQK